MSEAPKKSSYIRRRLGEACKDKSDSAARSIRDAYRDSVRLDDVNSTCPQPPSIREIESLHGFNISQQKKLGIVLNKTAAREFLQNIGAPIDSTFKQRHNPKTYFGLFQRDAIVIGQNEMICTYAEWMHLENWPYDTGLE